MIVEFAQLTIRPGSEALFEAAFPAAIAVLGSSQGYSAFTQWRAQVGPFFESAPMVEHFRSIAGAG